MNDTGEGKGKLVPTGKSTPVVPVTYAMSHSTSETKSQNGMETKRRKTVVHSIRAEDGHEIPHGDYDLMASGEMIRLKHVPQEPKWIVLSSED